MRYLGLSRIGAKIHAQKMCSIMLGKNRSRCSFLVMLKTIIPISRKKKVEIISRLMLGGVGIINMYAIIRVYQ